MNGDQKIILVGFLIGAVCWIFIFSIGVSKDTIGFNKAWFLATVPIFAYTVKVLWRVKVGIVECLWLKNYYSRFQKWRLKYVE